ncbi:MAG TPA: ABC transporter ATP-binding protein [Flavobacteriaceae bacterium]|nr:ABC transporter ATP-binding protein [Flavobacteriaceae bacterium]
MKNNPSPILTVENLSVGYQKSNGKLIIADQIDFHLDRGTLTALVGANGIGKSTLVRTLTAMQPRLGGNILICGKELKSFSPVELARKLSVVLTEHPASKNLSVFELIALGRQPHTNWMGNLTPADREAIDFAMEITDTLVLKEKKCYELSDGQLQRVAIARALSQDTPIIILDEPTTHLDIYHRAYIFKLMRKLVNEYRKTIFFSTHEIDLAIQLSDKMVVMTGEETYFDTPCALIDNNHFNHLFPEDTIQFDKVNGRFGIRDRM